MGLTLFFCEFSLFVSIEYLHNIRNNKLNQAFLIYFVYTEKLTDRVLWIFQPIFNQNLMDWSLVYGQPFHKSPWKLVQYFFRYPGDKQTNKHLNFPINRTQHTCNRQLFLEGRFKIIYWTFICFFLPIRDE